MSGRGALVALLCLGLGLGGCGGCSGASRGAPGRTAAQNQEQTMARTEHERGSLIDASRPGRVGRLVQNAPLSPYAPSEYCLEDGALHAGARFRIHRTNVFGVDEQLAALRPGEPVLVFGELRRGLDRRIRRLGPCPEAYQHPPAVQMRSDEASDECGFSIGHTSRQRLAALDYLEASSARPITLVTVLESGAEAVALRLDNPFDAPLSGALVWHYESFGGKPMPHQRRVALTLAPGSEQQLSAERSPPPPPELARRKGMSLGSARLEGRAGQVTLRLVVPLWQRPQKIR